MKSTLAFWFVISFLYFGVQSAGASIATFINEIHYDNAGGDVGEFVEIAGAAGTDLNGWTVALYNGSNSSVYATINLSGVIGNQSGNGFGTLAFFHAGIQNGSPDGLALVNDSGVVLEFLSYEGSITASGGPADGLISTDILVSETSSTPIGHSLQRTGIGQHASDFDWTGPAVESPGAINNGQMFSAIPEPASIVTWCALSIAGLCTLGRRRSA